MVTASGRGRWGDNETRWALTTISRTWRDRRGPGSKSVDTYALVFELVGPTQRGPEQREFATREARDRFFDQSISERRRDDAEAPRGAGCDEWFQALVGDRIEEADRNAPHFIDLASGRETPRPETLRLRFEHHTGWFALWPQFQLRPGGSTLRPGDKPYIGAIQSLVGQRVQWADAYLDEGYVLQFEVGELVFPPDDLRRFEYSEPIDIDGRWILDSADEPWTTTIQAATLLGLPRRNEAGEEQAWVAMLSANRELTLVRRFAPVELLQTTYLREPQVIDALASRTGRVALVSRPDWHGMIVLDSDLTEWLAATKPSRDIR